MYKCLVSYKTYITLFFIRTVIVTKIPNICISVRHEYTTRQVTGGPFLLAIAIKRAISYRAMEE